MKKKIILLVLSLVLVGVGLTGCGKKPMNPVVATESFVNMFIYNETSNQFKEAFANSEQYETIANNQAAEFKSGLNGSLAGQGSSITDEQSQKIFEAFTKAVHDKAIYTVALVEGNEKEATVKVTVTGIDYLGVVDSYFQDVMAEVKANPSIALDNNKLMDLALTKIVESLANVGPSQSQQEITLVLKADNADPSNY